jgi:hypothetical protein
MDTEIEGSMNDNISMDPEIEGSINKNINMDTEIEGSMNDNINMETLCCHSLTLYFSVHVYVVIH